MKGISVMLFDYVSATELDAAVTLRRAPSITGLSGIAYNSIAEKHRLELTGAVLEVCYKERFLTAKSKSCMPAASMLHILALHT